MLTSALVFKARMNPFLFDFDVCAWWILQIHRWVKHPQPHTNTNLLLPSATKLGQGYIFTGVCDSVHIGGSASVHAGIPPPRGPGTPPDQDPPRSRPPRPGTPPPVQSMLGHTVNARAVRILLECNLVWLIHFYKWAHEGEGRTFFMTILL